MQTPFRPIGTADRALTLTGRLNDEATLLTDDSMRLRLLPFAARPWTACLRSLSERNFCIVSAVVGVANVASAFGVYEASKAIANAVTDDPERANTVTALSTTIGVSLLGAIAFFGIFSVRCRATNDENRTLLRQL